MSTISGIAIYAKFLEQELKRLPNHTSAILVSGAREMHRHSQIKGKVHRWTGALQDSLRIFGGTTAESRLSGGWGALTFVGGKLAVQIKPDPSFVEQRRPEHLPNAPLRTKRPSRYAGAEVARGGLHNYPDRIVREKRAVIRRMERDLEQAVLIAYGVGKRF